CRVLDLAAQDTAGRVDLLDRQLDAVVEIRPCRRAGARKLHQTYDSDRTLLRQRRAGQAQADQASRYPSELHHDAYLLQKNCKLRNDTAKVLLHALCIRRVPGEQLECSDCLPYRHAAAVEVAAAAFPRCAQPFGFQREINDLGDPLPGLDPGWIDRGPRMAGHADRACVDHAVGRGDRGTYVAGMSHRASAETRAKASGQGLGLCRVGVDERQLMRAQGENRVRDRRTGAAGTEQADMAERDIAQGASKWRGEAGPIGIVADALAVPENDGIDRANRLG